MAPLTQLSGQEVAIVRMGIVHDSGTVEAEDAGHRHMLCRHCIAVLVCSRGTLSTGLL